MEPRWFLRAVVVPVYCSLRARLGATAQCSSVMDADIFAVTMSLMPFILLCYVCCGVSYGNMRQCPVFLQDILSVSHRIIIMSKAYIITKTLTPHFNLQTFS